ncbi:hypothetical protein GQX74_009351 [Glossina fuscipes]|nr:hypothetical protein GQX74_009351 [Glossina fuscipes]
MEEGDYWESFDVSENQTTVAKRKGNITLLAWKDETVVTLLSTWNNTGMTSTKRYIQGGSEVKSMHLNSLVSEVSISRCEVIKPIELPSCLCCWMTLRGTYNCTSRHVLLSSSFERLGSSGSSIFTSPSSKSSWVSSASKVETIN